MKKFAKVLLIIIAPALLAGGFDFVRGAIPQAERDALISLYYQTAGDYWQDKTGWLGAGGTENTWFGVTVAAISGEDHVTRLSLTDNNLTGSIPENIGNLSRLEHLSLDHNKLSGSIPEAVSNLTYLTRLVLDNNNLTGPVPTALGSLEKLESLGLNNNQLTGHIPEELTHLRGLQKLHLASNALIGPIPGGLKGLKSLTSLELDYNGLYTTSGSLGTFLDGLAPGWRDTQTVAPANVSVTKREDSGVDVTWTPITFTGNDGYYEVLYRTGAEAEGNYAPLGKTDSKSEAALVIEDLVLVPGSSYYFVVRTKTFPHEYNTNAVLSEECPEVKLMEAAYTLTVQSEPGAGVNIGVSPADINGEGSGSTNFSRVYGPGTGVTLTAPEESNALPFKQWEINGGTGPTAVYRRELTVVMEADITVTAIYKQPEIYVNPGYFNFAGTSGGLATPPQEFLLGNRGGGTLEWVIDDDLPSWLTVTPTSGTCGNGGSTFVSATVNTRKRNEEIVETEIKINAPGASNSPQKIKVVLKVMDNSDDQPPFGSFDTPLSNTTVSGSIAVSGWALDDIAIQRLKIYGEDTVDAPGQQAYIGDAVFIEGARPDVETAYPGYPLNRKAGWGYMLLTNALNDRTRPAKAFKLHVYAVDNNEQEVSLGTKTITIDNRWAVKPFGAMDTPDQGGNASGSAYLNRGWVLTPPGNNSANPVRIPEDGSTITLYLDGKKYREGAAYDIFRADVAAFFPGYANSEGAQAQLLLDTTALANGLHTIVWTAQDSAGHIDGIGSRFFMVRNSADEEEAANIPLDSSGCGIMSLSGEACLDNLPVDPSSNGNIEIKTGYSRDTGNRFIAPGENNTYTVEVVAGGRLEIHFPPVKTPCRYSGYMLVGNELRSLPSGSQLDTVKGVFYWQVGPGFYGIYEMVFLRIDLKHKEIVKIPVHVIILIQVLG